MYTKNKRKFQNKPAQRSSPRSVAPAPKFKNKKEKFLKETLPCIVLLIFMAFWSIGSALSIIDRIKQPKSNITARADTPSYSEEGITFTLDGFRGMYFNDSVLNLCADVFTVYLNKSTGSLTITNSTDSFEFFNDSSFEMQTEFVYEDGSFGSTCSMSVDFDNSFNGFKTASYVDFISYSEVGDTVQADISVINGYNDMSLFTIKVLDVDLFPVFLSSQYQDEFYPPNVSLISENNQLREEIVDLENEVQRLQSDANSNYKFGYDDGYALGFSEGVASANDYSWLGLIGAIVDVPVKAFTGLFDWNLLGINLKQFFFSLLSLCTVLLVVKLILR